MSPDDGGSPVTGFRVVVREGDASTFTEDQTYCDMSVSTTTSCVIPVETLIAAPFSLDWGSDIYAKVTAINTYGDSPTSEAANGAKIIKEAAAPESLSNVPEVTSAS